MCTKCDGPMNHMGTLGRLEWWKCCNCGAEESSPRTCGDCNSVLRTEEEQARGQCVNCGTESEYTNCHVRCPY